jgi:transposase
MQIAVLGIDVGKNSCSVVGQGASRRVVLRKSMRRESIIKLMAELPACIMAMEACCGAHHLARLMQAQGAWLRGLPARAHANTVGVTLASKLARIAWAVLRSGDVYEAGKLQPA